ncbi:MAG: chorismate synthase [Lentisphaerae bacterium]|nr:chorismate synthase [Lentisphaerota bacterium]
MASEIGKILKITVFGQSHGAAVGMVMDGFPAGEKIDLAELQAFMQRRAPGKNKLSTPRKEEDQPEFLSGLLDGVSCGAPLCAIVRNRDTRSQDYAQLVDIPRPGHADYTAGIRYHGFQDPRGGGHFSGRLSAAICLAGALCQQALQKRGICIGAHIASISDIKDELFLERQNLDAGLLRQIANKDFPVIDEAAGARMQDCIVSASAEQDSVGGCIECAILNYPAGIGNPRFEGLDARLAQAIFALPAVKGLEFGSGFAASLKRGSANNDPFYMHEGRVCCRSNNHGGVLGGISSGMPIIFKAAIKPTSSIAREQQSVSLSRKQDCTLRIEGRHDPCIVPRAVPVIEAISAIILLDLLLEAKAY